jgi:hypothetical protein
MNRNASSPMPRAGEPTELARYTVCCGVRVLYVERIGGVVCVTDRPAGGRGRSYLVECVLEGDGHSTLAALIADYTRQAGELDQIPMAASVVRRTLAQEAANVRAPQPLV